MDYNIKINDKNYMFCENKINLIIGTELFYNRLIKELLSKTELKFPDLQIIDKKATLISNLSVAQNIYLPLMYHFNMTSTESEKYSREIFTQFNIRLKNDLYPEHIKIHLRKFYSVIRALILLPKMIILDEISDLNNKTILFLLEILKKNNIFVVFTSEISSIINEMEKNIKNLNIIKQENKNEF